MDELDMLRRARIARESGDPRAAATIVSDWTEATAQAEAERQRQETERRHLLNERRSLRAEAASRREANDRLYAKNRELLQEIDRLRDR